MRWTIVYCPAQGLPACFGHFKTLEAAERNATRMAGAMSRAGTLAACAIEPVADWDRRGVNARSQSAQSTPHEGDVPMADPRLATKPAVLLLDDGSRVTLPDFTVGEAHEVVRLARELGEFIGGEIDPERVAEVGFESDEGGEG